MMVHWEAYFVLHQAKHRLSTFELFKHMGHDISCNTGEGTFLPKRADLGALVMSSAIEVAIPLES
jgi:hypothetical protein